MNCIKPFFLIILIVFVSCSSNEDDDPQANEEVVNFLNEVVNIMGMYSINRDTIDWSNFRNQVLEKGSTAQRIDQTDDALRLALVLLGDNHSSIRKQNGTFVTGSNVNCPPPPLETVATPDDIGYIRVRSFGGVDPEAVVAFAENIQEDIRTQDNQDITGWIVDLRNNTGGNMWPMLAGIGPILGEGTVGHFVGPDNSRYVWSFSDGVAILDSRPLVRVSENYELLNPNPKVAVLLNKAVISSGEAIAISFIGRENTMSFGSETCGLSTANSGFTLSNGWTLGLTTAYMADRNQNVFGEPITPDTPATNRTIVQDAINYLRN
ncbi:S41 family peptidase [Muricauda sp. SCSIO 64092]|uniref:S41 family peptidase n=1 Tax=Allomuricauda sp. SCSIO 64092 TaxID=2908842 RepID=UPI001FF29462|nr:S41 family peptidase [Muricauda sp. SCSIO 64092]UOY07309.1 S41 family peptidase [Muricauda sp. SCSIO 64092]